MILTYNGVDLEIEHFTVFEQTPVYSDDGVDFLYGHYRVGVKFVWNPKATANAADDLPAKSIADLRPALMAPRKHLFIRFENGQILSSPMVHNGQFYRCDANNGPKPIACNVLEFHGTKSAIGYFEIETWLNECTTARTVLSNRWEMSSDIDEHYYTTRTITGKAVFRADMLNLQALPAAINLAAPAGNVLADDYRSMFIPRPPKNFKRVSIHVAVASDATELRYVVVDQEQPMTLGPFWGNAGVTDIKGTVTQGWLQGSRGINGAEIAAAVGQSAGVIGPGVILAAAGGLVTFPTWYSSINVRAWGSRACRRNTLQMAAMRAAACWHFTTLGLATAGWTASITVDIISKYVELNAAVRLPLLAFVANPHQPLAADNNLFTDQLMEDLIAPDGPLAKVFSDDAGAIPLGDNMTRATYRGRVWAQSLMPPCANPWVAKTQVDHVPPNIFVGEYDNA